MSWYLGTNFGHGAAVAAVSEDGVLQFAVEEGRLIGEKDTSHFPASALQLVLDFMGSRPASWAEGWHPIERFFYKGLATTFRYGTHDRTYFNERFWREIRRLGAQLGQIGRWYPQIGVFKPIGHHLAHACSLLPWGLEANSLVVVSDYTGERAALSSYHWDGRCMRRISTTPFPHSLGAAYHQAATHLGFHGRTGPGKLMALAGYGRPHWTSALHNLATVRGGRLVMDLRHLPTWWRRQAWHRFAMLHSDSEIGQAVEAAANAPEAAADLAASVQAWFTDMTWRYIVDNVALARSRYWVNHLALAGGSALNCQTNGAIIRAAPSLGLVSVSVSPWSDDCGTAIGAAVMQAIQAGCRTFPRVAPFLGPYAGSSLDRANDHAVAVAIDALCAGEVIALVTGRLEFGPRALGGRCLLADPRSDTIKKRLNLIKSRPEFMPFAPVIHPEDATRILAEPASSNMAWTVSLKPGTAYTLPGLAHPTGEVRAQILVPSHAPLLARIMNGFRARTGVGVLLLTSLNGRDEPIPAFLEQALAVARRLKVRGVLHDTGWTRLANRTNDH